VEKKFKQVLDKAVRGKRTIKEGRKRPIEMVDKIVRRGEKNHRGGRSRIRSRGEEGRGKRKKISQKGGGPSLKTK